MHFRPTDWGPEIHDRDSEGVLDVLMSNSLMSWAERIRYGGDTQEEL